ncbi:MAG: response regulator transcription factor [Chitinophagaceae bacterium]|nr:response regulator transcription factor [Chitinophagaceae bacterium]MCA6455176.1 response regulator transcription factor [Chitinophagaceae bacterium]MCA6459562.1 response regulator transcription factor [Chitinophagaceae bacterium]MCA6464429.1 response regulator transcription factor [Chitinophagaceae bacterium]
MIRIALVDDHVVLRKSLGIMLGNMPGFEVVLEADNGLQLIEQLKTGCAPDLVLLDITMPGMDGTETARWLKQEYPGIKILVVTMLRSDPVILQMVKIGARGYLLKDCEPSELQEAINAVYETGYYYNELVTPGMRTSNISDDNTALSAQEISFLRWACTDLTHKEIAVEMQVSPRTIDGYRDSLFRKLNVTSRVGIVIYAIRNGFIQV